MPSDKPKKLKKTDALPPAVDASPEDALVPEEGSDAAPAAEPAVEAAPVEAPAPPPVPITYRVCTHVLAPALWGIGEDVCEVVFIDALSAADAARVALDTSSIGATTCVVYGPDGTLVFA